GQLDRAELQLLFVLFVEPCVQARGLGLLVAAGRRLDGRAGGTGGRGVGGRLLAGHQAERQREREGDGEGTAGERGAHDLLSRTVVGALWAATRAAAKADGHGPARRRQRVRGRA